MKILLTNMKKLIQASEKQELSALDNYGRILMIHDNEERMPVQIFNHLRKTQSEIHLLPATTNQTALGILIGAQAANPENEIDICIDSMVFDWQEAVSIIENLDKRIHVLEGLANTTKRTAAPKVRNKAKTVKTGNGTDKAGGETDADEVRSLTPQEQLFNELINKHQEETGKTLTPQAKQGLETALRKAIDPEIGLPMFANMYMPTRMSKTEKTNWGRILIKDFAYLKEYYTETKEDIDDN